MIVISLLLIGAAVVMLVLGLLQPSSVLLSASIGTSLLAAIVLVTSARRTGAVPVGAAPAQGARHTGDRGGPPSRRDAVTVLDRYDQSGDDTSDGASPRAVGVTGEDHQAAAGDPVDAAPAGAMREPVAAGPPRQSRHEPGNRSSDPTGTLVTAGRTSGGRGAEAERVGEPTARTVPTQAPSDPGAVGAGVHDDPADPAQAPEWSQGAGRQGASSAMEGVETSAGELIEDPPDEPAAQQVSPSDAARVSRMHTEVLVVDGRPRYHLAGCVHLLGRESEPLPVSEAVELGFSPCSLCEPDSALLADAKRV